MATIVVSIGRNEPGHGEMGWHDWCDFQNRVRSAILPIGTIVFDGTSLDELWEGEPEESCTIVAVGVGELMLERLRRDLAMYAHTWGQEAIALTVGQTELIRP